MSFITCPTWSSFIALTPLLNRDFGYSFSYVARSILVSGVDQEIFRCVGSGASRGTLYFLTISLNKANQNISSSSLYLRYCDIISFFTTTKHHDFIVCFSYNMSYVGESKAITALLKYFPVVIICLYTSGFLLCY